MNIKTGHDYLFYKLFKFWDNVSQPRFWSDAKATFSIIIIEIITILSFLTYYSHFISKQSGLFKEKLLYAVIAIVVFSFNFYYFILSDRWKIIVSKYDKWPDTKNNKGSFIVLIFISAVLINFIFSCWLS